MGYEYAGDVDLVVEAAQPAPEFHPDLGVERSERLVEEETCGSIASALASAPAASARRKAEQDNGQSFPTGRALKAHGPCPDLCLCRPGFTWPHIEAERHVVKYRHVPEQCVVLKNETDLAFTDMTICRLLSVEKDRPLIQGFEPGDYS